MGIYMSGTTYGSGEMNSVYIGILNDTLKKKIKVLQQLTVQTDKQEKLLSAEELDITPFGEAIEEKGRLLKVLEQLDGGFSEVYARVAEELKGNKELYKEQILEAQSLIKEATELAVRLEATEKRNSVRLAQKLSESKQKIKDFKVSSRTAAAYYRNMTNKHQQGDSYFLDKKK